MKKATLYVSIILILLAGVGLFFIQDIVKYLTKSTTTPIQNTNLKITNDNLYLDLTLNNPNTKLTKNDFLKGFWYEGPNGLVYFNVQKMLDLGYSMDEIKAMINKIKNNKIIKKENIKILTDDELDDDNKFYNKIYDSGFLGENNYQKIKAELEKKNPKKAIDYFRLSEIYSLQGEYKKSQNYLNLACKKDKKYCKKTKVVITGKVVDDKNQPLPQVEVKLLSTGEKTFTKADGSYKLVADLVKLKKERLGFSKDNYSPTFKSITNISEYQKNIKIDPIQMNKSGIIYTMNTKTGEIKGHLGEFKNNQFTLQTNISKYYIPKDAFVDKNNKKYSGIVKAYLFEFDRENVPQSLLQLDSFSKDKNFLGTSMITFGMPYIIFTKENGERLYVASSNPMILETKVPVVAEMYKGERLTDDVKKEIIEQSKKGQFYYTLKNINKNYLPLVPYWCLDQKTGVWENTGFDIKDFKKGILRTKFYTTI